MATDAAGPHASTDGSLVGTAQARYRVTVNPARSSPNFHDDPGNLGTTAVSVNSALQRAPVSTTSIFTVTAEGISRNSVFQDPEVFACFGLAPELDAQGRSAR